MMRNATAGDDDRTTTGDDGSADAVWRALAHPMRRRLLDELRTAPQPVCSLADRVGQSRFAVRKHLLLLQTAELVLIEARGRERVARVNPAPLRAMYHRWIRPFDELATDRLLRLRALAESAADHAPPPTPNQDPVPTGEPPMTEASSVAVGDLAVEVTIDAPAAKVWHALVHDTASWWHPEFYTRPDADKFVIEPKLGGHVFEDWGNGEGQIWGVVNGLRAPSFLQTVGDSSKDWGGPNRGIMTWRLDETDGRTTVRFTHEIFGNVSDQTRSSLESGWKLLFADCLKSFVETGARPDA